MTETPETTETAPPPATAPEAPQPTDELQDLEVLEATGAAPTASGSEDGKLDPLMGIDMQVQVVLGRCHMPIADLLALGRGSIVELDREIGGSVDVLVNQKLIARGDLTKLPDGRVGVTLTEVLKEAAA
ncbi:MAG: FliM/FliN family flagellar motor switch protein [Pseudomonadota bacterium]